MTTSHGASAGCASPIEPDVLMDYWLAALSPADENVLELHLIACDECGDRLREIISLAERLQQLARDHFRSSSASRSRGMPPRRGCV